MTDLWLIRHGETDWNHRKILQGWRDIALNDAGVRQAERVGQRMGREGTEHTFAAVYSSDLGRAYHTALPIAAQLGLSVTTDPNLRERSYGVLEGLTLDEASAQHPLDYAAWQQRQPSHPLKDGESLEAFQSRVVAALNTLAARHPGQHVVVVAHGGVLDMAWYHIHGLPLNLPRQHTLLNASVNRIGIGHDRWEVHHWGDVSHLTEAADELAP